MAHIPKSVNPNSGIKGLDIVLSNLNREIQLIKDRSMVGLGEAAMLVLADVEKTPPLIPVDTGNLRNSKFTTPIPPNGLEFGYTANYAIYVHEMMESSTGKKINWSRPDSGPKFLEASLKRNTKEILEVIAKNVKIPK
jgi:hypothetical protein